MKNVNRKLYEKKGFTLAEMLLTVSIIIILGAVVAVNVIRYRQNLKLTEMDNAAREIYMAAQNHLSESVSTGEWGQIYEANKKSNQSLDTTSSDDKYLGTYLDNKISDNVDPFPSDSAKNSDSEHAYYYIEVNSKSNLTNNALEQILPKGSIDETVRQGHYIIEYDALLGQVYSVFYTDSNVKLSYNDNIRGKLDSEINSEIKNNSDSTSRSNSKSLRKQFSIGNQKIALGYYGGAVADDDNLPVDQNISAEVVNGNRLYLLVDVPNTIIEKYSKNNLQISVTLKDLSLKNAKVQGTLKQGPVSNYKYDTNNDGQTDVCRYVYILDSPVETNSSIADADNVTWTKGNNNKFSIGDNLRAYVTVTAKTFGQKNTSRTFKAVSDKFNSAFAEGSTDKNARIENGRHLQNLAIAKQSTSGNPEVNTTSTAVEDINTDNLVTNQVSTVKILNDVYWNASAKTNQDDFFKALNKENTTYQITSQVHACNFTGIESDSIKNISGLKNDKTAAILSDFQINDRSGFDGLFAQMTSDSLTVKNLSLKDFSLSGNNLTKTMKRKVGNKTKSLFYSGSLIGYYTGSNLRVSQVTSDNVIENYTSYNGTTAGGLIGGISINNTNGKASITDCYASISSIKGLSSNSTREIISVTDLGGLIGSTEYGTVSVSRCYSSGRTINGGVYEENNPNIQVAYGNVGGLIGNAKGSCTAKYCYTTCFVSSNTINDYEGGSCGGFIGYVGTSANVSWCYSTGRVAVQESAQNASGGNETSENDDGDSEYKPTLHFGQFIGQMQSVDNKSPEIASCYVLSEINNADMPLIWDKTSNVTSEFEDKINLCSSKVPTDNSGNQGNITVKNPFIVDSDLQEKADPVDQQLAKTYPYCTTKQLQELEKLNSSKDKLTNRSKTDTTYIGHVGDWPVIKEEPATIGLIYYEGYKNNNEPVKYYYDGFWETMSYDQDQYAFRRMVNTNPLTNNTDIKGTLVEDGYAIILKVNGERINNSVAPNQTSLSDTNVLIGKDENNVLQLKKVTTNGNIYKMENKLNYGEHPENTEPTELDNYKVYILDEPDSQDNSVFRSLYESHVLNIYVRNTIKPNNTGIQKFASFNVNLYSANSIQAKPITENSFAVRSARQLYNLFWNAKYGNLTSFDCTINQERDIDFTKTYNRITEKYKNINYLNKLQNLGKLTFTSKCIFNSNGKSIKGLNENYLNKLNYNAAQAQNAANAKSAPSNYGNEEDEQIQSPSADSEQSNSSGTVESETGTGSDSQSSQTGQTSSNSLDKTSQTSNTNETDKSKTSEQSTPPISINLVYIYQLIVQKRGLVLFPKMKAFF